MHFRDDPACRAAYFALHMIIKHPCSPMSQYWWADVEAASVGMDWEQIDADLAKIWSEDDLFNFPLD
jgi:hypothetical protein